MPTCLNDFEWNDERALAFVKFFDESNDHDLATPKEILALFKEKEMRKPLFKTVDGKEVFNGDSYWEAGMDGWVAKRVAKEYIAYPNKAYFSSFDLAKEYVNENKKQFSAADIRNAILSLFPKFQPVVEDIILNLKTLGNGGK